MNMKKVAQALRLLADAMDGTELTELRVEDTGVSGPDAQWKPAPEPAPAPAPEPTAVPEPAPAPEPPAMNQSEFVTEMQKLGRAVGTTKLHAVLPAVWAEYTNGVARMSAIPADKYGEILTFARDKIARLP